MSRVINKLDRLCDHILVHTGQNFDYELNQIFFQDLEIRPPDHYLGVAQGNTAATIGRIIAESDRVFEQEAPEAILIYGDTNSGLSVISAKRRKIPVFHMEAGNRCFDQRVPEELNRKVIDHLSDINIVLSEHARRYLLAEGLPGDRIFKVGSHMAEVLDHFRPKIEASVILDKLGVKTDQFFLVSAHREENVDAPARLTGLLQALNAIADEYGFPVVVSTHPRTRQRLQTLGYLPSSLIQFLAPFSFTDYVRLQTNAYCVLSDSGTISEEAALLDIPAVTMREAHERPEGIEAGAFVMSGVASRDLLRAIQIVRDQHGTRRHAGVVSDYEVRDVSTTIIRIVVSYIDFVNRVVWSRPANGEA